MRNSPRSAATEGMVLLKNNDKTLPLTTCKKHWLYSAILLMILLQAAVAAAM